MLLKKKTTEHFQFQKKNGWTFQKSSSDIITAVRSFHLHTIMYLYIMMLHSNCFHVNKETLIMGDWWKSIIMGFCEYLSLIPLRPLTNSAFSFLGRNVQACILSRVRLSIQSIKQPAVPHPITSSSFTLRVIPAAHTWPCLHYTLDHLHKHIQYCAKVLNRTCTSIFCSGSWTLCNLCHLHSLLMSALHVS